jgi:hypothetical protein
MKMAISGWHALLLEPPTALSAYLWPLAVGLLAFGGEFVLARRLRRRRSVG